MRNPSRMWVSRGPNGQWHAQGKLWGTRVITKLCCVNNCMRRSKGDLPQASSDRPIHPSFSQSSHPHSVLERIKRVLRKFGHFVPLGKARDGRGSKVPLTESSFSPRLDTLERCISRAIPNIMEKKNLAARCCLHRAEGSSKS